MTDSYRKRNTAEELGVTRASDPDPLQKKAPKLPPPTVQSQPCVVRTSPEDTVFTDNTDIQRFSIHGQVFTFKRVRTIVVL